MALIPFDDMNLILDMAEIYRPFWKWYWFTLALNCAIDSMFREEMGRLFHAFGAGITDLKTF